MLEDLRERLARAIAPWREQMTVKENDNTFYVGDNASGLYRDRFDYDRTTIISECLRAWRVSPLARTLVNLNTQFIVGEGYVIKSDHAATNKFLQEWWTHPLNNLNQQIPEWCDERTRTGNLFPLITAVPDGMTYVRMVPSELIKDIQTAKNDVMQEVYYIPALEEMPIWKAYNPQEPAMPAEGTDSNSFMRHYVTNRPIGVVWGEPDLAPLLPWIGRYSTWLEDRVRLNHFRTSFMYVVRGVFADAGAKKRREVELNSNPPKSGSVLVTDKSEDWGILSASLDSFDAAVDGIALKKMIALGWGIPLHYLAEPESSTRTTAEASGTPTFRMLEKKQHEFIDMLLDLARIAVKVRKEVDRRVKPESNITIEAGDITERDNSNLALAASRIEPVMADLYDRELIDENQLLTTTYAMMGEVYDSSKNNMKNKGKRRPLKAAGTSQDSAIPKEPAPKDDTLDTVE
jgi:hypothetical protein